MCLRGAARSPMRGASWPAKPTKALLLACYYQEGPRGNW